MPIHRIPRFCRYCGAKLAAGHKDSSGSAYSFCVSPECKDLDQSEFRGPAVLAQTFIFAQSHLLLMRRGTPPYQGNWAPPGGFIEPNESAETAAIREIREEVGIQLDIEMLMPFATISIESINQIYLTFLARLDTLIVPHAYAPEALEARWFPERAFPLSDIWPPLSKVEMAVHFDRLRAGRFEFYQRTDEFVRIISDGERITYLRKGRIEP
jgi:ADP-ribose pyrophosphatase YjhB (NUDIX family)